MRMQHYSRKEGAGPETKQVVATAKQIAEAPIGNLNHKDLEMPVGADAACKEQIG